MTTKQTAHYETIQAKTVLNAVKAPSMPFDWSINPYRGCRHGCSFCYARSTHAFLGLGADDTFQNRILVKSNAAEALSAQLKRLARTRGDALRRSHVAIGTATDPYQSAEAEAKLTRACLELLAGGSSSAACASPCMPAASMCKLERRRREVCAWANSKATAVRIQRPERPTRKAMPPATITDPHNRAAALLQIYLPKRSRFFANL
ncbi:MAG TPA: hypothetical protein VMS09_05015 [Paenibacillus sp.]|nr:hypothetical protein [Paenibacillus sp.]HUC91378.1 hypothetical protein [Paenibacillus sp.]